MLRLIQVTVAEPREDPAPRPSRAIMSAAALGSFGSVRAVGFFRASKSRRKKRSMRTTSRFCRAAKRAQAWILVWSVSSLFVAVAEAQPKASESNTAELHLDLSLDFGGSSADVPQPLPADWRSLFQPPTSLMATERSEHAWFVELGVGLHPVMVIGRQWKIGVPVFYSFLGSAKAAGADARSYVYRKPVSGTKLQWWNPVMLHATAVQRTSPAVGLSVQRGRVLAQASFQAYRIIGEDFRGEDCEGCVNTSHLVSTQEFGRGIGHRVDVLFQHDGRDGVGAGIGVFFERNGSQIWQLGAHLRLTITIAERRKTRST